MGELNKDEGTLLKIILVNFGLRRKYKAIVFQLFKIAQSVFCT